MDWPSLSSYLPVTLGLLLPPSLLLLANCLLGHCLEVSTTRSPTCPLETGWPDARNLKYILQKYQ